MGTEWHRMAGIEGLVAIDEGDGDVTAVALGTVVDGQTHVHMALQSRRRELADIPGMMRVLIQNESSFRRHAEKHEGSHPMCNWCEEERRGAISLRWMRD